MAAALGADAGFSVDELDDIRLALSEVFSALADAASQDTDARVHVSFAVSPGSVRIDVSAEGSATNIDLDELALGILRSVSDDFDVTPTAVVLVKHATEAAAGLPRS
jgi:anti-sigma regulatory factor (Ser/Thr protein kinase)